MWLGCGCGGGVRCSSDSSEYGGGGCCGVSSCTGHGDGGYCVHGDSSDDGGCGSHGDKGVYSDSELWE